MSEPPINLQAGEYMQGGVTVQRNIPGKYRRCAEMDCDVWIECPFVNCQKHRTDFAVKDTFVKEYQHQN